MRVLKRPPKPANWEATVRQAKREVNKVGRSGGEPDFTDEAKQHWRTFKKNLEDPETKLLRCAYCEVSLTADRYHGDVEHYRPKAAATDRNWHIRNGKQVRGTPGLLNPYKDKHPEKHLEFDKLGAVRATGSGTDWERGRETIEICDLDRDDLRKERIALAESAILDISSYLRALKAAKDPIDIKDRRESLQRRMDAKHPHSGMIRIIFYQMTKRHWRTL